MVGIIPTVRRTRMYILTVVRIFVCMYGTVLLPQASDKQAGAFQFSTVIRAYDGLTTS